MGGGLGLLVGTLYQSQFERRDWLRVLNMFQNDPDAGGKWLNGLIKLLTAYYLRQVLVDTRKL